jgi:hypothetical protein
MLSTRASREGVMVKLVAHAGRSSSESILGQASVKYRSRGHTDLLADQAGAYTRTRPKSRPGSALCYPKEERIW